MNAVAKPLDLHLLDAMKLLAENVGLDAAIDALEKTLETGKPLPVSLPVGQYVGAVRVCENACRGAIDLEVSLLPDGRLTLGPFDFEPDAALELITTIGAALLMKREREVLSR